jgi:hypothetical protein
MESNKQTDECCPLLDPAQWDEKEFSWENKIFVKTRVFCILNMPLNFGGKMRKLVPLIEKAGSAMSDGMVLSEHTSSWNMNLYIAVDKVVPGTEHATISGRFISKVYEGPFQNAGKWMKDFSSFILDKGLQTKKLYLWYTACPKCSRKFGKNYVVLIGEIG